MNINTYDETTNRLSRKLLIIDMNDLKYYVLIFQILFTFIYGYVCFVSKNINYYVIYMIIQFILSLVDFAYSLNGMSDLISYTIKIERYIEDRFTRQINNSPSPKLDIKNCSENKITQQINNTPLVTNSDIHFEKNVVLDITPIESQNEYVLL